MRKLISAILTVRLFLAGAALPAFAQKTTRSAKVESGLVDDVALFDNGQIKAASTLLKTLSAADPANDAVHYYLGMCFTYMEQYDDAVLHLREASRLDPSNFWYRDRLARVYVGTGQSELAIDIYESLLKEYPKKTDIYYTLVQLYGQQGKVDEVLRTLDEIETVTGKDDMVALTRYDILMRQQKPDEAYAVLEAYNRSFDSPRILVAMGDHCVSQFRDTLAVKYYNDALSFESGNPQALLGLSEIYRYRGDFPNDFATVTEFLKGEAAPSEMKTRYIQTIFQHSDPQFFHRFKANLNLLIETYRDQAPQDSTVLQTVSAYYFNTGEPAKAREAIEDCCRLYPQSVGSRGIYVQLLTLLEDWEAAGPAAEQAFQDFPQQLAFLEMKTYSDYNLKDYDALIRDNERILEATAPRDTTARLLAWSGIGDAWHMLGESRKAYEAYEHALKIDPRYLPVLNNYAYYLCLEGKKLKKAAAMSKLTIEAEPDNATYLDTYGWILYLQGKAAEAKPYFKHAMLYGGKDSAAVLDHYAEVLYRLKEYDTARVYWNLARNKNTDGAIPDLDARVEARLKAVE